MFVITADQVGSQSDVDRVPPTLAALDDVSPALVVPPARFAGDELQFVTEHASVALDISLRLTRSEHWSVGLGVGAVRSPLPDSAAAATGTAFVQARKAIDSAKRSPTRFALRGDDRSGVSGDELGALIDLLLTIRARRSDEGWAVCDLMAAGMTQTAAAERLGVTPQAVSLRLRTAGWRIEERARPGLVVLLSAYEDSSTAADRSAADDHD